MIRATTISEVITHLDTIIERSIQHNDRTGYFAALYRQMTLAVMEEISLGNFSNGERMAQLDVNFANKYLQAWEAYSTKAPCSNAWCAAFNACSNGKLVVLQHLLLGINTHINLDLAIAAAETCPGSKIYDLQADFQHINNIIASLSQKVQDKLTAIWFPLRLIKKIANKREEAVLNFSINAARKASWANAVALALVSGQAHNNYISLIDNKVVALAKGIVNPGFLVSLVLKPVNWMEDKSVAKLIRVLND